MFKRALGYYKPYKFLFFIDLMCAILVAILEMVFPYIVNHIVDDLLPIGNWKQIVWSSLFLLATYLISTGLTMVIEYWGEKLGMFIENDMRVDLFSHLQKLSFRYYDNNKTGQLISKVSNDLHQIGTVAHYAPEQLLVASSMLILTVVIMARVNWQLSLVVLFMVVVILTINIVFTKKMVNTMRGLFVSAGEIAARLEESISGIRVVQAYAKEEYQKNLFLKDTKGYCKKQEEGYRSVALCNGLTYYLTRLLPVLTLLGGGYLVVRGHMTNGQFFSYILLTNLVLKPVEMISNFAARYPKGIAGFRNFLQLMDVEPEVKDIEGAKEVSHFHGNIEFKQVDFSYDGTRPVLSGINLSINEGQTIAFVGNSGAGKTSLCSLIPRFYDIQSGSITIDGIDIKKISLHSLRSQIGIVQQDVFLFAGTIEENIRFGKSDATIEEVWEAARNAKLDEFILNQPEGMNTIIGERGVKMSGGQKQRLSIARMFLKNPSILILDEATSALDTENEVAIHQALDKLAKGRTTLIIAHRFSTIQNATRIVVVEGGVIAEEGTHEQLRKNNGIYEKLYGLQHKSLSA